MVSGEPAICRSFAEAIVLVCSAHERELDEAQKGTELSGPQVDTSSSSHSFRLDSEWSKSLSVDEASMSTDAADSAIHLLISPTAIGHMPQQLEVRKAWLNEGTAAPVSKGSFVWDSGGITSEIIGSSLGSHKSSSGQRQCTPLHPTGRFRVSWNVFCILCIAWDIVTVPVHLTFSLPTSSVVVTVDMCMSVFWTVDILVSALTGYRKGNHLEMDFKKVFRHYALTYMLVDIAIVVMEWLGHVATEIVSGASTLRLPRTLRVLRAVRLLRVAKLGRVWGLLEEQVYSDVWLIGVHLVKWVLMLAFLVHITACCWHSLGLQQGGWITNYGEGNGTTPETGTWAGFPFWYAASARWALAQINGETDQDPFRTVGELFFTIVITVTMALLFMSIFVSSITTKMMEAARLSEEMRSRSHSLGVYLRAHSVSSDLTQKIKYHLVYTNNKDTVMVGEKHLLEILPHSLSRDLLWEVRRPDFIGHSLFACVDACSPRLSRYICHTGFTSSFNVKHDVFFDVGDACSRMLFLHSGAMVYTVGDRKQTGVSRWSHFTSSSTDVGGPGDLMTYYIATGCTMLQGEDRDSLIDGELFNSRLRRATSHGQVKVDTWVSEVALWCEWFNQGRLAAAAHTCVLSLESETLLRALCKYKEALSISLLYINEFMKHLREFNSVTDVVRVPLHWNDEPANLEWEDRQDDADQSKSTQLAENDQDALTRGSRVDVGSLSLMLTSALRSTVASTSGI